MSAKRSRRSPRTSSSVRPASARATARLAAGAHQRLGRLGPVGGVERRLVRQSDPPPDSDVGGHRLERLPSARLARDQKDHFPRMRLLPQAVERRRRDGFSADRVDRPERRAAQRLFVHRAEFDQPGPSERPRQDRVQSRTQHADRRAETLVDGPLVIADERQPAQPPTQGHEEQQHRRRRPAGVAEREAPREVDAELSARRRAEAPFPHPLGDKPEKRRMNGGARRFGRRRRQKGARRGAQRQLHADRESEDERAIDDDAADKGRARARRDRAEAGGGGGENGQKSERPQVRRFRRSRGRDRGDHPLGDEREKAQAERRSPDRGARRRGRRQIRTQPPCGHGRKDGERRHERNLRPARRIPDRSACNAGAQHHFCRYRARRGQHEPSEGGADNARADGLVDERRPVAKCEASQHRKRGEAIGVGKAANQRLADEAPRRGSLGRGAFRRTGYPTLSSRATVGWTPTRRHAWRRISVAPQEAAQA